MSRLTLIALLALVLLACSTADMVQTATPIPTPSAMPTAQLGALAANPFLSTPADFGTIAPDERTVCADALNVRSGPSLESSPVAWLRRGDRARVLEERDGWLRVASPAGWVRGVYLCQ